MFVCDLANATVFSVFVPKATEDVAERLAQMRVYQSTIPNGTALAVQEQLYSTSFTVSLTSLAKL